MAESKEPKRPIPGAPLPRLWKIEPEPEEEPRKKKKKKDGPEDAPAKGKKKKSEKNGQSKGEGEEKKGVLLEETPTLDTYEARQRARWIVAGVAVLFIGLTIFILYKVISPAPSEPETRQTEEAVVASPAHPTAADREHEASSLYERARVVAKGGGADRAVSMLKEVTSSYPGTKAAQEARQALDRPKQNLPLFLESPTVLASQAQPKPTEKVALTPSQTTPGPMQPRPDLVQPSNADATNPPPSAPPNAPPPEVATGNAPSPAPPEPTTKPLPQGFHPRPGTAAHSSGWPLEIVGDRDGAIMVLVPGGVFTMGRDDRDPAEAPAHKVDLATYYVDQHEVTNGQFEAYEKEMGERTERTRALARMARPPSNASDEPVVMVTAREARFYADWAGKRLPTEAQWEKAARGTDGRIYPWGMIPVGKPRANDHLEPVQSFLKDVSPFGAYDMAGNAWEWTKDWFDPRYFHLSRNTVPANPQGPDRRPHTLQLSIKGNGKDWAVTDREGQKYETRLPMLGFRCVLPVEGPDSVTKPATPTAPVPGNQPTGGANQYVPF